MTAKIHVTGASQMLLPQPQKMSTKEQVARDQKSSERRQKSLQKILLRNENADLPRNSNTNLVIPPVSSLLLLDEKASSLHMRLDSNPDLPLINSNINQNETNLSSTKSGNVLGHAPTITHPDASPVSTILVANSPAKLDKQMTSFESVSKRDTQIANARVFTRAKQETNSNEFDFQNLEESKSAKKVLSTSHFNQGFLERNESNSRELPSPADLNNADNYLTSSLQIRDQEVADTGTNKQHFKTTTHFKDSQPQKESIRVSSIQISSTSPQNEKVTTADRQKNFNDGISKIKESKFNSIDSKRDYKSEVNLISGHARQESIMRKLGMIMEPGNFKKWRGKIDFLKQVVRKANVNELGSTTNLKFKMSRRVKPSPSSSIQANQVNINTKNEEVLLKETNRSREQVEYEDVQDIELSEEIRDKSEQSKDGVSLQNSQDEEDQLSETGLLTIYESCFGFSIVNEQEQKQNDDLRKVFKKSRLSQSLDTRENLDGEGLSQSQTALNVNEKDYDKVKSKVSKLVDFCPQAAGSMVKNGKIVGYNNIVYPESLLHQHLKNARQKQQMEKNLSKIGNKQGQIKKIDTFLVGKTDQLYKNLSNESLQTCEIDHKKESSREEEERTHRSFEFLPHRFQNQDNSSEQTFSSSYENLTLRDGEKKEIKRKKRKMTVQTRVNGVTFISKGSNKNRNNLQQNNGETLSTKEFVANANGSSESKPVVVQSHKDSNLVDIRGIGSKMGHYKNDSQKDTTTQRGTTFSNVPKKRQPIQSQKDVLKKRQIARTNQLSKIEFSNQNVELLIRNLERTGDFGEAQKAVLKAQTRESKSRKQLLSGENQGHAMRFGNNFPQSTNQRYSSKKDNEKTLQTKEKRKFDLKRQIIATQAAHEEQSFDQRTTNTLEPTQHEQSHSYFVVLGSQQETSDVKKVTAKDKFIQQVQQDATSIQSLHRSSNTFNEQRLTSYEHQQENQQAQQQTKFVPSIFTHQAATRQDVSERSQTRVAAQDHPQQIERKSSDREEISPYFKHTEGSKHGMNRSATTTTKRNKSNVSEMQKRKLTDKRHKDSNLSSSKKKLSSPDKNKTATSAFGNQSRHSRSLSTSNQDLDNLLVKQKTKSSQGFKNRSQPKKSSQAKPNEQGDDYGLDEESKNLMRGDTFQKSAQPRFEKGFISTVNDQPQQQIVTPPEQLASNYSVIYGTNNVVLLEKDGNQFGSEYNQMANENPHFQQNASQNVQQVNQSNLTNNNVNATKSDQSIAAATNDGASVLRMMNPTYASPFQQLTDQMHNNLTLEQTIKAQQIGADTGQDNNQIAPVHPSSPDKNVLANQIQQSQDQLSQKSASAQFDLKLNLEKANLNRNQNANKSRRQTQFQQSGESNNQINSKAEKEWQVLEASISKGPFQKDTPDKSIVKHSSRAAISSQPPRKLKTAGTSTEELVQIQSQNQTLPSKRSRQRTASRQLQNRGVRQISSSTKSGRGLNSLQQRVVGQNANTNNLYAMIHQNQPVVGGRQLQQKQIKLKVIGGALGQTSVSSKKSQESSEELKIVGVANRSPSFDRKGTNPNYEAGDNKKLKRKRSKNEVSSKSPQKGGAIQLVVAAADQSTDQKEIKIPIIIKQKKNLSNQKTNDKNVAIKNFNQEQATQGEVEGYSSTVKDRQGQLNSKTQESKRQSEDDFLLENVAFNEKQVESDSQVSLPMNSMKKIKMLGKSRAQIKGMQEETIFLEQLNSSVEIQQPGQKQSKLIQNGKLKNKVRINDISDQNKFEKEQQSIIDQQNDNYQSIETKMLIQKNTMRNKMSAEKPSSSQFLNRISNDQRESIDSVKSLRKNVRLQEQIKTERDLPDQEVKKDGSQQKEKSVAESELTGLQQPAGNRDVSQGGITDTTKLLPMETHTALGKSELNNRSVEVSPRPSEETLGIQKKMSVSIRRPKDGGSESKKDHRILSKIDLTRQFLELSGGEDLQNKLQQSREAQEPSGWLGLEQIVVTGSNLNQNPERATLFVQIKPNNQTLAQSSPTNDFKIDLADQSHSQTNRHRFQPNLRKNKSNLAKTTHAIKRIREGPLKKIGGQQTMISGENYHNGWTLVKQSSIVGGAPGLQHDDLELQNNSDYNQLAIENSNHKSVMNNKTVTEGSSFVAAGQQSNLNYGAIEVQPIVQGLALQRQGTSLFKESYNKQANSLRENQIQSSTNLQTLPSDRVRSKENSNLKDLREIMNQTQPLPLPKTSQVTNNNYGIIQHQEPDKLQNQLQLDSLAKTQNLSEQSLPLNISNSASHVILDGNQGVNKTIDLRSQGGIQMAKAVPYIENKSQSPSRINQQIIQQKKLNNKNVVQSLDSSWRQSVQRKGVMNQYKSTIKIQHKLTQNSLFKQKASREQIQVNQQTLNQQNNMAYKQMGYQQLHSGVADRQDHSMDASSTNQRGDLQEMQSIDSRRTNSNLANMRPKLRTHSSGTSGLHQSNNQRLIVVQKGPRQFLNDSQVEISVQNQILPGILPQKANNLNSAGAATVYYLSKSNTASQKVSQQSASNNLDYVQVQRQKAGKIAQIRDHHSREQSEEVKREDAVNTRSSEQTTCQIGVNQRPNWGLKAEQKQRKFLDLQRSRVNKPNRQVYQPNLIKLDAALPLEKSQEKCRNSVQLQPLSQANPSLIDNSQKIVMINDQQYLKPALLNQVMNSTMPHFSGSNMQNSLISINNQLGDQQKNAQKQRVSEQGGSVVPHIPTGKYSGSVRKTSNSFKPAAVSQQNQVIMNQQSPKTTKNHHIMNQTQIRLPVHHKHDHQKNLSYSTNTNNLQFGAEVNNNCNSVANHGQQQNLVNSQQNQSQMIGRVKIVNGIPASTTSKAEILSSNTAQKEQVDQNHRASIQTDNGSEIVQNKVRKMPVQEDQLLAHQKAGQILQKYKKDEFSDQQSRLYGYASQDGLKILQGADSVGYLKDSIGVINKNGIQMYKPSPRLTTTNHGSNSSARKQGVMDSSGKVVLSKHNEKSKESGRQVAKETQLENQKSLAHRLDSVLSQDKAVSNEVVSTQRGKSTHTNALGGSPNAMSKKEDPEMFQQQSDEDLENGSGLSKKFIKPKSMVTTQENWKKGQLNGQDSLDREISDNAIRKLNKRKS